MSAPEIKEHDVLLPFREPLGSNPSRDNPVSGFLNQKGRQSSIRRRPRVGARWHRAMLLVLQQCNEFPLSASPLPTDKKPMVALRPGHYPSGAAKPSRLGGCSLRRRGGYEEG
jgi:hypothetical protein